MATIFFNAFGQKGTLSLWAFVVLVQYMMGSSMVRGILHTFSSPTLRDVVRFLPHLVSPSPSLEMARSLSRSGSTA